MYTIENLDASNAVCEVQTGGGHTVMGQEKISLLNCFSSAAVNKTAPLAGKTKKTRRNTRSNFKATNANDTDFPIKTDNQDDSFVDIRSTDVEQCAIVQNEIGIAKKIGEGRKSNTSQSIYEIKPKTTKNDGGKLQSNLLGMKPHSTKNKRLKNQHNTLPISSSVNTYTDNQSVYNTNLSTSCFQHNTQPPVQDLNALNSSGNHPVKTCEPVQVSTVLHQQSLPRDLSRKPRTSRRDKDRGRARSACRERSRVEELRQGYQKLQEAIPAVPKNTKLAKLDVLMLATSYIAHLTRLLEEDEGAGTVCYEDTAAPPPVDPPLLPSANTTRSQQQHQQHTSQQHHTVKITGKRWPMRARLYAAVGASPPDVTSCACVMTTPRESLVSASQTTLLNSYKTTSAPNKAMLQEGFNNFLDTSTHFTPGVNLWPREHSLQPNIYESMYDVTEHYYEHVNNYRGVATSEKSGQETQKILNVNPECSFADFSNPEDCSPIASFASNYNLIDSWPCTEKQYNKQCQLPPPPAGFQ